MGARLPFIELPELRDRHPVFRDREHAGLTLAGMLGEYAGSDAVVLAVPAGGVAVALPIARTLGLALELAVVSKITLPWDSEVGYGAVAFDGTARLNEELVGHFRLSEREIESGTARTREKVERRVRALCGGRPPSVRDRPAILVDDGLASGFTMRVAAEAVRGSGAARVIVAVPTASARAAEKLAGEVDALYCANVRGGPSFAVADAYEDWYDVSEEEVARLLGLRP